MDLTCRHFSSSLTEHVVDKPSVYFVTLKVMNRAGKKSVIAPSYKGLKEGFHIGTGSIMKITREFQSSEPLLLRAFDPDSLSSMLINNRKSIIVKPAKFKDNVTDVIISSLSKHVYIFFSPTFLFAHSFDRFIFIRCKIIIVKRNRPKFNMIR